MFTQISNIFYQICGRGIACKYEYAESFIVFCAEFGDFSSNIIFVTNIMKSAIPGNIFYRCVCKDFNFFVLSGMICDRFCTGEIITAYEDGNLPGKFCKKYTFFCSCKSTTYNEHVLSCEEFTVACCTIGNAMAFVFFFSFKSHSSRVCTCCKEYAETIVIAVLCVDSFDIVFYRKAFCFGEKKFCSEILRLLAHSFSKFLSAYFVNTWIVHDFGGDGNLTAEVIFFNHQHTVTGTCEIKSGTKPGRPSADHNHIVKVVYADVVLAIHYNKPTRSRLGLSVSAPGCHFAGQT